MAGDLKDDDDLFVDIDLRSWSEIRARVRILDTLCQRVALEYSARNGEVEAETAQEERFDLLASVLEPDVNTQLSLQERAFLDAEVGDVDPDELEEFATCQESLIALAIALKDHVSLPEAPLLVDRAAIDSFIRDVESGARLLSPSDDELEAIREYFELWQWRAFVEADRRGKSEPEPRIQRELEEVLDEVRTTGLHDIASGADLADALSLATGWTDEDLARFELAVSARLHAIEWLCGIGNAWDEIDLEA